MAKNGFTLVYIFASVVPSSKIALFIDLMIISAHFKCKSHPHPYKHCCYCPPSLLSPREWTSLRQEPTTTTTSQRWGNNHSRFLKYAILYWCVGSWGGFVLQSSWPMALVIVIDIQSSGGARTFSVGWPGGDQRPEIRYVYFINFLQLPMST